MNCENCELVDPLSFDVKDEFVERDTFEPTIIKTESFDPLSFDVKDEVVEGETLEQNTLKIESIDPLSFDIKDEVANKDAFEPNIIKTESIDPLSFDVKDEVVEGKLFYPITSDSATSDYQTDDSMEGPVPELSETKTTYSISKIEKSEGKIIDQHFDSGPDTEPDQPENTGRLPVGKYNLCNITTITKTATKEDLNHSIHICHVRPYSIETARGSPIKQHLMNHETVTPHSFDTASWGRHRQLLHTIEKPHACSLCPHRTTWINELIRHMSTHTADNLYRCDHFPYKSKIKSHNLLHMHKHRTEKPCADIADKPYTCLDCSFKSAWKCSLKINMKTHSADKPFACPQCSFQSAWKGNLKEHMKTHSSDKSYACAECPFKSVWKGSLKTHIRNHCSGKSYACTVCYFKCVGKGIMKEHMKAHSADKPYAFPECSYKSAWKGNLKTHMKTHSSDKPYACRE